MHDQTNEPPPLLAEVEEHPDRRRSYRTFPEDIYAELRIHSYPHPHECICVNFSINGVLLLVDLDAEEGSRVSVNLIGKTQRIMRLTGQIIRSEKSDDFTRVTIAFDAVHKNNPILRGLLES